MCCILMWGQLCAAYLCGDNYALHTYVGTIMCCILMWGQSLSMINSLRNIINPPKKEINPPWTACGCPCPCGGVSKKQQQKNVHTHLTPQTTAVSVQLHIPGDPHSVQLRNASTIPTTSTTQNRTNEDRINHSFIESLFYRRKTLVKRSKPTLFVQHVP